MNAIIFDLDGTLIDSTIGILGAFTQAFAACGLDPIVPLVPEMIGPPLPDMLKELSGTDDPQILDQLTAAFKAYYDSTGYLESRPFPGVETMLATLSDADVRLHIATNKRAFPTQRILTHLGWNTLFDKVYSLDNFEPPFLNKTGLIAKLLVDIGLGAAQCAYIGDRWEDGLAAQANHLSFYWAMWGFGSVSVQREAVDGVLLKYPDPQMILRQV